MAIRNILCIICLVFLIGCCISSIQSNRRAEVDADNFSAEVDADNFSAESDASQSVADQDGGKYDIYAYNEYDMNSKYPIGTPNISCATKNSLTDDEHLYSDKYNGKYTGQTVFVL